MSLLGPGQARGSRRRAAAALLAGLGVAAGLACGGGGGGGGGGPTAPPPGINFTPASAPSLGSCYLGEDPRTNPNRLFLDVRVNEVDDWYGVAFDLFYPEGVLDYATVREGGFPGGNTSLEVSEVRPGHLVVGHTKLGPGSGRSGSGLLMTLEFTPVGNGSGSMTFDNQQAFRTNSFPLAADFIAGSVSVTP